MTGFLYQQLARASAKKEVNPGEEISVSADLLLAHDGTGSKVLKNWKSSDKLFPGKKAVFTLDHAFPAPSSEDRRFHKEFSEFCKAQGCCLYNHGEGVLHQVVAEQEFLWPGMMIVGADGHVATAGAFSALAFSVSPEELAQVMKGGYYTLKVPEQIVISIDGVLAKDVLARDIAMYIIKELGESLKDKAVALTGSCIYSLSADSKMAICNYLPEGGVITAFVLPEAEDGNADIKMEADRIVPLAAVPSSPSAIEKVADLVGTKITVAIAGGCSAGRLEDMKQIAQVLSEQKVHPDVTFVVTPASRKVLDAMEILNIPRVLREAGAVILPPGCGPCPGKHLGVLSEGDTAITTTIRNTPGRIGSDKAQIYLASPLTVAIAAVKGEITDPPYQN